MSYQLRTVRAFSAELMKIAAQLEDSDIRKLLAERNGDEYLEGGKLEPNAYDEDYARKTANYSAPMGFAASDNYNLKAKKKKKNSYQKVRDYAGSGLKGGLTGLGVLGAVNAMKGRFGAPVGEKAIASAMKSARKAALIGASVAVADRAYRYDDLPGKEKDAGIVSPALGNSFRSPASAAAVSRRTGGFKTVVRKTVGKPPATVQVGQKFRLP